MPEAERGGSTRGRGGRWTTAAVVAGLLTLLALARIVATYRVLSHTYDEPAHIAAGLQWLEGRRYNYDSEGTPLPRAAVALGPYLDGRRLAGERSMWDAGRAVLYARNAYLRNLTLARLGTLPFFVLTVAMVWVWGRRLFAPEAAAIAVALVTLLPAILGHAGLATTDVALTGMLLVALFAFTRWLERPSVARGAVFGAAAAGAVLAKMSALVFLPVCSAAILALALLASPAERTRLLGARAERRRTLSRVAAGVLVGGAVLLLTLWAGYRFDYVIAQRSAGGRVPIPAPAFLGGLHILVAHQQGGHPAFLLGEISQKGWWYFFPVVLAVKTPIAFALLAVAGASSVVALARRQRDWRPAAPLVAAGAIVLVSMAAQINLGVRHVLPAYPLLAIVAGAGAHRAWHLSRHRSLARALVAALVLWLAAASVRAHPDYIAYFNELAGAHPERILSGSDLDWGQDLTRLNRFVQRRGIDRIAVAYFGSAIPARHLDAAVSELQPTDRVHGWIAISEGCLQGFGCNLQPPGDRERARGYRWLEAFRPAARVGRAMRVYYVAPGTALPRAPE